VVALLIVTAGLAWLAYTRLYFWLHPRNLTFDPSPIMYLTGRPDPACGLTRTFAWMWQGDVSHAVAVYPLGPLLWIATFPLIAYGALVVITGSALRLGMASRARRALVVTLLIAITLNWLAKLIWLGM
jgi:hypothetical protein